MDYLYVVKRDFVNRKLFKGALKNFKFYKVSINCKNFNFACKAFRILAHHCVKKQLSYILYSAAFTTSCEHLIFLKEEVDSLIAARAKSTFLI